MRLGWCSKVIVQFEETDRCVGSGGLSKVTAEIKQVVEELMQLDDETTAVQLHRILAEKGYSISLRTILRCRGSAYCQHINEGKIKWFAWAREHLQDLIV